jgi:hypothetical protein
MNGEDWFPYIQSRGLIRLVLADDLVVAFSDQVEMLEGDACQSHISADTSIPWTAAA